jgi:hypothetical protein
MLKKIVAFWDSLPGELKISVYYILASGLTEVANILLATESVDIQSIFRVWLANIILYFLTKAKSRSEILKGKITTIK